MREVCVETINTKQRPVPKPKEQKMKKKRWRIIFGRRTLLRNEPKKNFKS